MIARLRGKLIEKEFTRCVIETGGGVGYEVAIPLSTFDRLPLEDGELILHIHTQVREDAIALYGFATPEEKELFTRLIEVSGIGGKLALNVLSSMPVANFAAAINCGDVKTLSRINGVGKRTAERMIVELKGKLEGTGSSAIRPVADSKAASQLNDAALALEKLGFKRDAINKTLNILVAEIPPEEQTSEKLLRAAIMKLKF